MTAFQLLYDLTFYFDNTTSNLDSNATNASPGFAVVAILQCISGLAQSLVCNEIYIVVLITVRYKKSIPIVDYFYRFILLAVLPSIIPVIFYIIYLGTSLALFNYCAVYAYLALRLVSIATVIVAHACTSYLVTRMLSNATLTGR